MRISSSGNVGIGETSPDAPLHITSATPIISFDESDASKEYRIGSYGGTFAIRDETASNYRVVVDTLGNVGIGTTTPINNGSGSQGLTINGTGNYQNLTMQVGGTSQFIIYTNGYTGTFIDQLTADPIMFLTSDTERMRIDANGKVGIGTASPNTALHIVGLNQTNGTLDLPNHPSSEIFNIKSKSKSLVKFPLYIIS